MGFLPTKIANILLLGSSFLLLFFGFLFSDSTMVGFSDFRFLSGTTEVDSLHIEMTGGDTTGFSIVIYNKESTDMTYRLGFVDAGITNDSFALKTCLGPNQTTQFGQYITGNTSLFTLPAGGSGTYLLSANFPRYYSGTYTGCILFYPAMQGTYTNTNNEELTTDSNTLPRKGIFMNVDIHPNGLPIIVKAFSSNRVYQTSNNANIGILKIYDSNKFLVATSDTFELNGNGTGQVLINIPTGTYYAVFKGQSHLASYLSGILLAEAGGYILDFTTGSVYNTQNLNSAQNDGNQYQSAGDLKNIIGKYDHTINGNDIAILTANGFQESGIAVLDPKNLNGDGAINVSDISVIGVNFEKTDPFYANNIFNSLTTR